MTVSYTENGANVSTQVKFGILGDDPSIIFTEPAFDDTVSLCTHKNPLSPVPVRTDFIHFI